MHTLNLRYLSLIFTVTLITLLLMIGGCDSAPSSISYLGQLKILPSGTPATAPSLELYQQAQNLNREIQSGPTTVKIDFKSKQMSLQQNENVYLFNLSALTEVMSKTGQLPSNTFLKSIDSRQLVDTAFTRFQKVLEDEQTETQVKCDLAFFQKAKHWFARLQFLPSAQAQDMSSVMNSVNTINMINDTPKRRGTQKALVRNLSYQVVTQFKFYRVNDGDQKEDAVFESVSAPQLEQTVLKTLTPCALE